MPQIHASYTHSIHSYHQDRNLNAFVAFRNKAMSVNKENNQPNFPTCLLIIVSGLKEWASLLG